MEENIKLIESLLEKATEYGKTNFEIIKLKVSDKVSDVVSTAVPYYIVSLLSIPILIFANFGLAFWLGEILGKIYFGFFAIAGFYLIIALFVHFALGKSIKRAIYKYIMNLLLN